MTSQIIYNIDGRKEHALPYRKQHLSTPSTNGQVSQRDNVRVGTNNPRERQNKNP